MPTDPNNAFVENAYTRVRQALVDHGLHTSELAPTLPSAELLDKSRATVIQPSTPGYLTGKGPEATLDHLLRDIVPGLNGQGRSGRYFGFVTGGALPIAEAADYIVSSMDQNVQVHLPNQSVATNVEDAALKMLASLLRFNPEDFPGRTFTTGATASNVLGLACGREAVIQYRLPEGSKYSVATLGLLGATRKAGIKDIQILTSLGHSSLAKAASVVGIGHYNTRELPVSDEEPWRLDVDAVERELQKGEKEGIASIIAISAGEVNTGMYATTLQDMQRLRSLADKYKAWIHVDGAFGIFARALPETEAYRKLHESNAGLELADSITADGHKLLNVPYDTGMFYTRNVKIQTQAFTNPNAVYLATAASEISSPLNVGIENSRRFRSLPTYAALVSEGRDGLGEMFVRITTLARNIAKFIRDSPDYEWLPNQNASLEDTHVIVLFKATDPALNDVLVDRINETRKMTISGTKWKGEKAIRLAVGSWRVDPEKDLAIVKEMLTSIAQNGRPRL